MSVDKSQRQGSRAAAQARVESCCGALYDRVNAGIGQEDQGDGAPDSIEEKIVEVRYPSWTDCIAGNQQLSLGDLVGT